MTSRVGHGVAQLPRPTEYNKMKAWIKLSKILPDFHLFHNIGVVYPRFHQKEHLLTLGTRRLAGEIALAQDPVSGGFIQRFPKGNLFPFHQPESCPGSEDPSKPSRSQPSNHRCQPHGFTAIASDSMT